MPDNNRNSTSPARLEIRAREERAVELRMAGLKWKDIAAQVWGAGTDPSTARKAVVKMLREHAHEPAEELRGMEVARLDRMLQALWPEVLRGKWLAIDRVLKIQERKALLLGLDAPQKRVIMEVTPEALEEAMQARELEVAEMRAQLDAPPPVSVDLGEIDREVAREIEQSRRDAAVAPSAVELEEVVDAEVVPDGAGAS